MALENHEYTGIIGFLVSWVCVMLGIDYKSKSARLRKVEELTTEQAVQLTRLEVEVESIGHRIDRKSEETKTHTTKEIDRLISHMKTPGLHQEKFGNLKQGKIGYMDEDDGS